MGMFGMNNKQREEKKSIGARERKMGELCRMMENFWSVLDMKTEEPGW